MTDRVLKRIEMLERLEDGWDGGSGYAIIPEILSFIRDISDNIDDYHIFPDTNGTVLLQLRKGDDSELAACLSVGIDQTSYVIMTIKDIKNIKVIDSGKVDTVYDDVINVINTIDKIKQIRNQKYCK